ncbi:pentapeptide repeat-containing protein [Anabaena sp. UHCC 0187]|uniref:pentapeptide repeat-containing protein n=1 Tax=Anabaena sp. UHCC 0187 TaxID=2590018 RepID=UPI001446027E|nr:pentapeptide repeat-containing protein [Anabaena sp. UHCC 0187]MTJ11096.1 pentapeptide repeat-containing protein [Anabaena sp. UHCC 0187]
MANPEHLAILNQGKEFWDEWRYENEQNPDIRPDLSSADLKGADLSGLRLSETNLIDANLCDADLCGANLCGTNLSYANLSGADLSDTLLCGANLCRANLSGANLYIADLSDANLSKANLTEANLRDANLYGANLREANLSKVDLSGANLAMSQVIGTNFHNANLTGTSIKHWQIDSETNLDGVICEYVYYNYEYLSVKTERRPINGNFAPGEFASLYKKIIENTDLILRKTLENDNTFNKLEKNIDVDNTFNNQGVQFFSTQKLQTWKRLRFRSKHEIKIAEALDRTGVLFLPNSLARLTTAKGRENKEADFLICYNGKWGVLEVDGPFHTPERRVEEQERERIFKKNGIKVVERFDFERCYNNPDEVVQEFFKMIEIGYS